MLMRRHRVRSGGIASVNRRPGHEQVITILLPADLWLGCISITIAPAATDDGEMTECRTEAGSLSFISLMRLVIAPLAVALDDGPLSFTARATQQTR